MTTTEGLAQTIEELAQIRAHRLQSTLLKLLDTHPRLRPTGEGSGSLIPARMDNWISHGRFAPPPFVPLLGWLRYTYGSNSATTLMDGLPGCYEKFLRMLGAPSQPKNEDNAHLALLYFCYAYEESFIHGVEKVVENIWQPVTFGPASMTKQFFGS
jgi:hypothetical protein